MGMRMDSNLEKLEMFWVQRVSSNLTLLTITVGIAGLTGCAFFLWVMGWVFTSLIPLKIYTAEVEIEILQWIHQAANPLLDALMLAVTRLCNPEVAVPVGLVTLVTLLVRHARLEAGIFAIAGLGAILLHRGLKLMFARLRPDLYPQLIQEETFSFPSSHALGATVLYGAIAYLLAKRWPQRAIWIYLLTTILVIAIGFSRLYLGVHWPTDVLAGWITGCLWLTICITMLRLQTLQKEKG